MFLGEARVDSAAWMTAWQQIVDGLPLSSQWAKLLKPAAMWSCV
jgi:hypothetical protein